MKAHFNNTYVTVCMSSFQLETVLWLVFIMEISRNGTHVKYRSKFYLHIVTYNTVLNCHDFLSIINCHVTTAVVDWEWVSENMINILNRFWYFGQPIITILRNSNATLGCRKHQKSNLTIFSYAWMQKNNLNYSMSSVSRGCFQNYNENNVKI